jgi:glycosyltransferase involved in cell wall biosynthesis
MAELGIVVTAFNEADRIGATVAALREAFPAARLVVADDASGDGTAEAAAAAGAEVVSAPRRLGKGGAATLGVERVRGPALLLCDGDLGDSARHLVRLTDAVEHGDGDLAIAVFARSEGGGFGIALGAAGRIVRRLTGLELRAPISGQRALAPAVVDAVVPFAPRFGMEIGMTVDAHRAGFRIVEVELPLAHRATGRTSAGFTHRARQLADFVRVYASRRS